jgi:hypothetical protein
MRPEGLDKMIKFNYLTGLEPATFRLVAWCINHYATAFTKKSWYITKYVDLIKTYKSV